MPGQALTAPRAFAFGKLPSHGDFVARGLSPDERDAWDTWSSAGLEEARATLGDDFETRHDAARPVRFVFGPGPFGDGWRAGALAPSIDTAGRRFIIVLGAHIPCAPPTGTGDIIATAAENEIYRAFENAADIDEVVVNAQDVFQTMESVGEPETLGRFWLPDSPFEITASQPPADLITRVLTI
jgi:type VI secretion system protein ImpM